MNSCDSCVYDDLSGADYPCSICRLTNKYKFKEDGIMRNCETCLYEELDLFDEPCVGCGLLSEWKPKYEEVEKFKIGDIIVGIDDEYYSVTNSNSICKVVDIVTPNTIRVELIGTKHYWMKYNLGTEYIVKPIFFKLYNGDLKFDKVESELVNLVFVKFNSNKEYLFLVPKNINLLDNTELICNTKYGKTIGRATCNSFTLPKEVYEKFISEMGIKESNMKSILGLIKDVNLFE